MENRCTGVAFAKNSPMIKLENEIYSRRNERILLESSFWSQNCVYILSCSPFVFIASTVMGNKSMHLLATVKALQASVLMCTTSFLPLLRLLLFHFNAYHKCVMYACFVNGYRTVLIF